MTPEMEEAIAILRSDGTIAAYNKMTKAHQEVVERLDHIENNYSEYRASKDQPKDEGKPSDPESDTPPVPEPPPIKEPDPEPKDEGRKAWWERGGYPS